ncbi:hypothetical protein ISS85_03725 [Candidatus Microgenomates bacterium]|nr:hypothetical protein [Candidatus Microgenomates bacterium]
MAKNNVVFVIFFSLAFLIVLLHLLFHPIRVLGMSTSIFYLDEKVTLAAFFSIVTSFLTGFWCLMFIDKLKNQKEKLFWSALGVFFLILSIDEYLEIHEYINTLVKLILKKNSLASQLAHLSWIFPLFLVIGSFFAIFLWGIFNEKKSQIKSPLAIGTFFFTIVLILEILGALAFGQHIYLYLVALEEGAEMFGASFFLLAVLNKSKNL